MLMYRYTILVERSEGRCGCDDRERELHPGGDGHDAAPTRLIGGPRAAALRVPSTLLAVEY